MINDKWSFLSINVKRIKASEKRLKLFDYFENWSTLVVFIFLEEYTPQKMSKKNGATIFKDNFLFSHHKANFCGVAIGYYGIESLLNFWINLMIDHYAY